MKTLPHFHGLIAASIGLLTTSHATSVLLSPAPSLTNAGATWQSFGNYNITGGPAFGFADASGPGSDAFDVAGIVSVDGTYYTNPDGDVDITGNTLTSDPNTINGLIMSLQYTALSGSPTLRTLVTMTNAGAATVSRNISYEMNWGSDGGTLIRSTSSGDTSVTTSDRWSVTSDGSDFDPVNLTAFGTPGGFAPSGISTTAFDNYGTEGLSLLYNLSFAPGETRHLLFYHSIYDTSSEAIAAASTFNSPLTGEFVSNLPSQGIANFSVVPEPSSVVLAFLSSAAVLRRRRYNNVESLASLRPNAICPDPA